LHGDLKKLLNISESAAKPARGQGVARLCPALSRVANISISVTWLRFREADTGAGRGSVASPLLCIASPPLAGNASAG